MGTTGWGVRYLFNHLSSLGSTPEEQGAPKLNIEQRRWLTLDENINFGIGAAATVGLAVGGPALGSIAASPYALATAWQLGREAIYFSTAITVLGRFPQYLERARVLGANALNIPMTLFSKLAERQWEFNVAFLDRAIARGHSFVFTSNANLAQPGSYFAREIQYLQSKGYMVAKDGLSAIKP